MTKRVRRAPKVKTQLSAKAVVASTEAGKLLTTKERDFTARMLLGEEDNGSMMMESPLVQEAIIEGLSKLGITNNYVAEHIRDGLEATKLNGKDATEHADWASRHKYLESLLELAKVKHDSSRPSIGSVHLHYKSNLRSKSEVIDVKDPTSEKAKRRLMASRPTNRKGA